MRVINHAAGGGTTAPPDSGDPADGGSGTTPAGGDTTHPPAGATYGVDVSGSSVLAVSLIPASGVTSYDIEYWVSLDGGTSWAQADNGAGNPFTFTGLTASYADNFDVRGVDRAAMVVRNAVGAPQTVDRIYRVA